MKVVVDVFVFDSHDSQAARRQYFTAFCIVCNLSFVYFAVNLKNQVGGVAIEVNEEAVYDLLAAEVKAAELVGAKTIPKNDLLFGHFLPQFFGALKFLARDFLAGDDFFVRHLDPHPPTPSP